MNEGSALIEFYNHQQAEISMRKLNKAVIGGLAISVSWAKYKNNSSERKQNTLQNITNVLN